MAAPPAEAPPRPAAVRGRRADVITLNPEARPPARPSSGGAMAAAAAELPGKYQKLAQEYSKVPGPLRWRRWAGLGRAGGRGAAGGGARRCRSRGVRRFLSHSAVIFLLIRAKRWRGLIR